MSIFASDLNKSKEFYRQILGWQLGTDEDFVAGFHFGAAYLVIMQDHRPDDERLYNGGLHVEVKVDDVDLEHVRLKSLGVAVSDIEDKPWGERNFSFIDPDGYQWFYGQAK